MEFATSNAENVLGRLASHASQEISLAWGAQLELTKLNKTLSAIKLVLKDAEKRQVRNPLITRWLGNLKDVCHDVDDVLDELDFQKLRLKVEVDNCGKIKGKVHQFFSRWNPIVFNFKMGHKVKEIRERLVEIDNERREFALFEVAKIAEDHCAPQGMHDNKRETDSLVEASDVIGRDDDKKQIISHLLNNTDISSEENVSVISILGLGGLGKTTLAKLVYNDSMVEENFEMKMWICVSENFDIRTLIRGIINAAIKQKCKDDSLDNMKRRLQNTLRDRKFLLVLDDVWDTELIGITIEKWNDLKTLLNVGANGSKIIITTRNRLVASFVSPLYMHSLEGLSHKDCMSLFIQRAFKRGEEQRYQHLIEIGEDIVKKCGGVPLAVTTVGSMLYLNTEQHHWLRVRDDDMWSIGNDNILSALKLSYDALPQHLKPCLAFCSLFPKDFEFRSVMLVRCVNLKSLGEEIEFLNNLGTLSITSCNNLESLPPNMEHMTALDIDGCEKLQAMMRSKEGPQGLRSLVISNSSLEALPPWLVEDSAGTLQSIALYGCQNLTALPELIKFRFLEQLHIGGCFKLSALPQGLHCLTHLREMQIKGCPELSKSCKRQLKGEEWSKMARQVKITLDDSDDEADNRLADGRIAYHRRRRS